MIDIATCFTYVYSAGTYADFYEAVTVAAVSARYLDLDVAGIKIAGGSKPPWLIVKVGTLFATIVSLGIKLVTDSVAPVLDAATAEDVFVWRFAVAKLTAGALLINQPIGHFDFKRYMFLEYEPYTNATAGSLVAYLQDGPESAPTQVAQTVEAGT
jgi:hypothetical protein